MAAPVSQAVFQVVAMHHSYLYAALMPLWGGIGLSVYRSPVLCETEDAYKPVRDVLKNNQHLKVWSEVVADESMMFGEAEHTVYKMEGKTWLK